MSGKTIIYIGAFIGSTLGSFIPVLWGASFLSVSSLIFSGIGGLIGIFIGIKIIS